MIDVKNFVHTHGSNSLSTKAANRVEGDNIASLSWSGAEGNFESLERENVVKVNKDAANNLI